MSSPSSSSSATAGRFRWRRPRTSPRSALIEWGAAALVAAALYLLPSGVVGALAGSGAWPWVAVAGSVVVLAAYASRRASPLVVLGLLVLVAVVEWIALLGSAVAERCGDSELASGIESAGVVVLLLGLGSWGIRSRRLYLVPAALLAAAVWASLIAHLVPGGAGACFE